MFKLTNARGETVDINTPSLRSYTPTGLGLQITNSYSPYETYFIPTKSVLSQGIMQVYMKFGDIESQSYQSFSDFAQFLAYQPYTLEYDFDDNTYYRNARLQSLTKTEIGGSTIDAFDRLNEIFTLEFINNWYNNKTAEYKSYDPDPNLGTYGKIYRPKYDPMVNKNYLINSSFSKGFTNWTNENNLWTVDSTTYADNPVIKSPTTSGSGSRLFQTLTNPPAIGSVVTVSFNAKGTKSGDKLYVTLYGLAAAGSGNISLTTDMSRYSFTMTVPSGFTTPNIYFWNNTVGDNIYINEIKLDYGSQSTDWTPAPEDNLAIPFRYAYAPYYVYQESGRPSNEKVMSLNNKSQYFGLQSGSPSIITVKGPCSVNPTWTVVQKGNVVATDGFVLTLTDNQKLVVSSYPEDQYARLYNPDGSYVDVSQLQDYTKTNFVQIPEGESTVLFYLDADSDVNITFKEERLLV